VAEERKLGRGLDSLLSGSSGERVEQQVQEISLDDISPNPYQPRERISPESLEGLIASVQENGILQPITVRPVEGGYQLVTGERRFRAAQQLGMKTIPAVVRDIPEEKMLELALVENVQREDLNPIEKARAYKELIETFDLTQEEVARRVGQERSTVANFLRLLDLPEEVQRYIAEGKITTGHAKALLSLSNPKRQVQLCKMIVKQDLSVRETERLTGGRGRKKTRKKGSSKPAPPAHIRELEDELRVKLGTRVRIQEKKGNGRIIIEFFGADEFERILSLLGVNLG